MATLMVAVAPVVMGAVIGTWAWACRRNATCRTDLERAVEACFSGVE